MARILIVDDDPNLLRLLGLRLTKEGFEVVEASSGNQALSRLGEGVPDLVVTDLVGSSRVDLQACKLEYSIVSPK